MSSRDKRFRADDPEIIDAVESERVFLTSDLHFFKAGKAERGEAWFQHWIDEINGKVKPGEWVILMGDVFDVDSAETERRLTKKFLSSLNADKVGFLRGNNDLLSDAELLRCGYSMVGKRIDTDRFVLSHYPLWIKKRINLHGHLHRSTKYEVGMRVDNRINVFCGNHGDRILRLSDYMKNYRDGNYDGYAASWTPDEASDAEKDRIYRGDDKE
jgi:metallophosphoesterase superfamily enzyme